MYINPNLNKILIDEFSYLIKRTKDIIKFYPEYATFYKLNYKLIAFQNALDIFTSFKIKINSSSILAHYNGIGCGILRRVDIILKNGALDEEYPDVPLIIPLNITDDAHCANNSLVNNISNPSHNVPTTLNAAPIVHSMSINTPATPVNTSATPVNASTNTLIDSTTPVNASTNTPIDSTIPVNASTNTPIDSTIPVNIPATPVNTPSILVNASTNTPIDSTCMQNVPTTVYNTYMATENTTTDRGNGNTDKGNTHDDSKINVEKSTIIADLNVHQNVTNDTTNDVMKDIIKKLVEQNQYLISSLIEGHKREIEKEAQLSTFKEKCNTLRLLYLSKDRENEETRKTLLNHTNIMMRQSEFNNFCSNEDDAEKLDDDVKKIQNTFFQEHFKIE